MALTRTSPLLAGSGESGVDLRSAARRLLLKVSRSLVIFAHDLAAALASPVLAFLLLENGHLVLADARFLVHAVPLFLALASASFLAFGLHRGIWSYTSISDLGAVAKASTGVILLFVAIELVAEGTFAVPRTAWVIQWLVLVVLLCGTRPPIGLRRPLPDARAPVPTSRPRRAKSPCCCTAPARSLPCTSARSARRPD